MREAALRDEHVLGSVRAVHAPPVGREVRQHAPVEARRELEGTWVRRRGWGVGGRHFSVGFIMRIKIPQGGGGGTWVHGYTWVHECTRTDSAGHGPIDIHIPLEDPAIGLM